MDAGNKDSFRDAIECCDDIYTCACARASGSVCYEFGKLRIDENVCTFIPIEEPSMIFRPRCFLFLK